MSEADAGKGVEQTEELIDKGAVRLGAALHKRLRR